MQLKIKN